MSRPGRDTWQWTHYTRPMAYQRDLARGARCWLCGGEIDYSASNNPRSPDYSPWAWEPDHRYDVVEHPELAEDIANVMPAHSRCNRRRRKLRKSAPSFKDDDFGKPTRDWGI